MNPVPPRFVEVNAVDAFANRIEDLDTVRPGDQIRTEAGDDRLPELLRDVPRLGIEHDPASWPGNPRRRDVSVVPRQAVAEQLVAGRLVDRLRPLPLAGMIVEEGVEPRLDAGCERHPTQAEVAPIEVDHDEAEPDVAWQHWMLGIVHDHRRGPRKDQRL